MYQYPGDDDFTSINRAEKSNFLESKPINRPSRRKTFSFNGSKLSVFLCAYSCTDIEDLDAGLFFAQEPSAPKLAIVGSARTFESALQGSPSGASGGTLPLLTAGVGFLSCSFCRISKQWQPQSPAVLPVKSG